MKRVYNAWFLRMGEMVFLTHDAGMYAASYIKERQLWVCHKFGSDVYPDCREFYSCAEMKQWVKDEILDERALTAMALRMMEQDPFKLNFED